MSETHSSPESEELLVEAHDLLGEAVRLRRTLHARPEIGLHLPFAQERICDEIDDLGLTITTGRTTSSVVGILEGGRPGPTVLLRGDMDALPMPEDTGEEFSSNVDNAMHACGHDLHVAMLVGAARLLKARQAEIPGRVLFMFQPGEEGYAGARYMLEEGLLDVPARADGSPSPVTGAFAIHASTNIPSGHVGLRGGTLMASSDVMSIKVTGRGGHGSAPHNACDPIPVACEIVQALQTMVTRHIDVFDPAVVTVTQITAGTTSNVIPETAHILGTIRAVSEHTRNRVHAAIRRVAEGIASAHDTEVEIRLELGYPVTVNDAGFAGFTLAVADGLIGSEKVHRMPSPVMGAEDFSYVLQNVQGSMAFLGACPPDLHPRTAPPNHSNRVRFDESAMTTGIALYTSVALAHLEAEAIALA